LPQAALIQFSLTSLAHGLLIYHGQNTQTEVL